MGLTPFWKDWSERVFWTALQGVLAIVIANVAGLQGEYVPVLMAALAAVKGMVARHVGDPNTASTVK